MANDDRALSLSELNGLVRNAIYGQLPETYWICAETSDVRVHTASGHCYLEFVEKDERSGQIVAKARGVIWAQTFHVLQPYFEEETKQSFVSGLKVLVRVSVEFHVLYGYSLTVEDIEPSYTVGDMVKTRRAIVRQLQEEGIFELNKELPMPTLPQRIAVITSPTAAGYEDFASQLIHNEAGYAFYLKLFPAIMQGDRVEASVIEALDAVCRHETCFDVVVMIRGGGSASDLHCFDSYPLAAHCAQFPLPVITGIGHERDDSVVDLVAHTRMKTPTAVANFLIDRMDEAADELGELQQTACALPLYRLVENGEQLRTLISYLPSIAASRIERSKGRLLALGNGIIKANVLIIKQSVALEATAQGLRNRLTTFVANKRNELELSGQYLKMASPDYVLQRGYTIILKEGRIVKRAAALAANDSFIIRFADGERAGILKSDKN